MSDHLMPGFKLQAWVLREASGSFLALSTDRTSLAPEDGDTLSQQWIWVEGKP